MFAVVTRREMPRGPDPAALLSAIAVPVMVLCANNRFRFANQAAEQFLGVSMSQLHAMALSDLVPGDSPLFALIAQVRAHDATISDHDMNFESPRLRKQGITVQGSPLPEEAGCIVLTMQDASAARALDRQLSFRSAARSVTGMAAILAHEVKNPLSGIRGAAQLLEASVSEADRELTVLIRDEADRIRDLVDRMEVFGEKPTIRGPVNIHRVLEHVRRLAQSGFAAHIAVREIYDPSLPSVFGNRDQLVQVVLNLVKNAAEAITFGTSAASGEIILTTAYQHGMRLAVPGTGQRMHLPLVVTVRDNGPGIPEDIRPNLFDAFVTSKPSGSGLGLALVAKIVADHGGLIEVDSRPGSHGVPIASCRCCRTTRPTRYNDFAAEASIRIQMTPPTVLIADDDRSIRTVLTQALGRSGYQVRSTGNAATLWRWVEDGEGDLVITDVVMPDENGLDLIPRIKRMQAGTAYRRHERSVHPDDGSQGNPARSVRISAQTVRPASELLSVVGRALATPSEPDLQVPWRTPRIPTRTAAADRPQPRDAGDLPHHRTG